ncbi:MAG: AAA family ATPase, partial [Ardenticatenales bacterium]
HALRRASLPAPLAEQAGPLVGRDAERRALATAWRTAADGRGGVVVVSGEAGMGKSRLVAGLLEDVAADGRVWYGRCHESTANAPYAPLVQALRDGLSVDALIDLPIDQVWLREIARLLPELETVVADGRNAPLDGVRDRDRLFEAVCAVVGAAAAAEPIVLVIEDLHWADETSAALLSTLARTVSAMACLLVVTVRDVEIAPERRAVLRSIEAGATKLPLAPLSAAETAALVQALSGAEAPPVQFASQLAHRTGGNPLFLVETLRALFEQGTLSAEADGRGWTTTAGAADGDYAELPVPESIGQIVDARIERLLDDARTLADAASVQRRDFEFDVVQRASGLGASAALDALDALLTSGLWRETASDGLSARYDFAHALVRDRIYGRLSAARRQHLHRQVAGLLETSSPEQPDRVAYHYLRGGVRDRACAWSLRAGDAAMMVYAADNALSHYRAARQLAAAPAEQFAALTGAGHAFVALGRAREAVLTYTEALTHAPDDGERAEIERCIGRAFERRGEFDSAIAAYLRARDHLRSHPATLAALRTADGLATVYIRLGRVDEALALGKDALTVLAVSNALSDAERTQAEAWLRNTLGMAYLHGDQYPAALENLARSLTLKRQIGDRLGEATVLNNLGVVHYHAGDDEAALVRYEESLAIKLAIADHYGRAIALTNIALIETHLERNAAAAVRLDEADAAAQEVGASWLVPEIRRVMAQRDLAAGDVDGAARRAGEALAAAEDLGVPAFIGVAHRVLGQVNAVSEVNAAAAEEHFQTSLAVFEMLADRHEQAKTEAAFGAALLHMGRTNDAIGHLRHALDTFARAGAHGRAARIERLLDRGA